jgi:hypothetical protein
MDEWKKGYVNNVTRLFYFIKKRPTNKTEVYKRSTKYQQNKEIKYIYIYIYIYIYTGQQIRRNAMKKTCQLDYMILK